MMAYVYAHIRLDRNEVFYIGIGSDSKGKHRRAHSKKNRNKSWHSIVERARYTIEILLDNISWAEALLKEVEIIAMHKRKCDGGTLVNLTLGGEGNVGCLVSEETRKKQSLKKIGKPGWAKGRKIPREQVERLAAINKGRKPWNKGVPASEKTRHKMSETRKMMTGIKHPKFGKKLSPELAAKLKSFKKGNIPWNYGKEMTEEWKKKNKEVQHKKIVQQLDRQGKLIAEYESCSEAARQTGFHKGHISNVCVGRYPSYKGFLWRYKNEETQPKINLAA